jgi:hypothetical protein
MVLTERAVIESELNFFPIPRNEPETNPTESVTK